MATVSLKATQLAAAKISFDPLLKDQRIVTIEMEVDGVKRVYSPWRVTSGECSERKVDCAVDILNRKGEKLAEGRLLLPTPVKQLEETKQ